MNYQGDTPNTPQERQQTATGYQQQQGQRPTGQQTQGVQQSAMGGGTPQQYQQQYQQSPQGMTQQPGTPQPAAQQPATQQTAYGGTTQTAQPQQGAGMGGGAATATQQGMQQQTQVQGPPQRLQFAPVRVEDVIQTDVATVQRDTPIATISAEMAEKNVGDVVVVEDDGKTPVGIVTDRKIALAVEQTQDIDKHTAEELIDGDLVTGTTEMTVFDALDRLSKENFRRLPIVDQDGNLQGIVTLDDILILMGNQLQTAVDVIGAQANRVK